MLASNHLVTDKLFSAILDKSIRVQAFWQKIANNKTQKTNNNQIQNINDQKIAWRWVGLEWVVFFNY